MINALLFMVVAAATILLSSAFVTGPNSRQCGTSASQRASPLFMATVIKPPETETEKRQKKDGLKIPEGEGDIRGPVEWLIDDPIVSREFDEPFHILLLDQTFTQNDRITIEYVASSCTYVLAMPYDEAAELASHAEKEGFSCLGTWNHDECTTLAGQLQNRDIVCRVVPFCEGGDRAWQARKDAKDESDMKRAEDAGWN
jgi:hypothetical protein